MTPKANNAWTLELDSGSVEQTLQIGRCVGSGLAAGDVVGMVGPLGAGKTQLAKGIAAGLGVSDDRQVTSPTFVLVNEYVGRLHVYHLDVFRLGDVEELIALGFGEMCHSGGVVMLEWADRVQAALSADTLWINMSLTGPTQRRLTLQCQSPSLARRLLESGLDPL